MKPAEYAPPKQPRRPAIALEAHYKPVANPDILAALRQIRQQHQAAQPAGRSNTQQK